MDVLLIAALALQSAAATIPSPAASNHSVTESAQTERATVRSVPKEQRAPLIYEVSDNRIFFRANVAGEDVWAMLDTGASQTLIDIEFARAAGLSFGSEEKAVRTSRVDLPTWRVFDVPILIPGQFEADHPRLAAVDMTAASQGTGRKIEFVLGEDFLRVLVVLVDPSKRTLQFAPSGSFKAPSRAIMVMLENGSVQTEIAIGGEKALVTIDTGFNGALSLSPFAWARIVPKDVAIGSGMRRGAGGRTYATKTARLPEIRIGALRITDVLVDESPAPSGDGLLGMGILGRFRLALDIGMNKLWIGSAPPRKRN